MRFFYREFKFRNTTWYSYLHDHVVPYVESRIVYDSAVNAIDYSGEQVRVTAIDGRELLADKVILTIPVAISDTIEYTPKLPEAKQQANRNVYVPSGLKMWIEFEQKFYSDMQLLGNGEDSFYFNSVFRKPSTRHALTYFDVGPNTYELTDLQDDEIVSKLMLQLDEIYDGQATRYYVNHHVENWAKRSFIGGAYSFDWDSYDWTIRELQRPVNRKLYFAGEHTEFDEVSTVHGAAMSGRRAVQDILKDVQVE